MLKVRFKDLDVVPDTINIHDPFSGAMEGSPESISRDRMEWERERASKKKGVYYIECELYENPRFLGTKTIPPYRYSVEFVAYADELRYKLTIVFFDFEPTTGLADFLSAKTENLEFKKIADSMSLDDYIDSL